MAKLWHVLWLCAFLLFTQHGGLSHGISHLNIETASRHSDKPTLPETACELCVAYVNLDQGAPSAQQGTPPAAAPFHPSTRADIPRATRPDPRYFARAPPVDS